MTITSTTVQQTASEELGTPTKDLYYLIIKNSKNQKLIINVGKKTHEQVQALLKEDETEVPRETLQDKLTEEENKKQAELKQPKNK
jgi:uncharacterized protein YpmB